MVTGTRRPIVTVSIPGHTYRLRLLSSLHRNFCRTPPRAFGHHSAGEPNRACAAVDVLFSLRPKRRPPCLLHRRVSAEPASAVHRSTDVPSRLRTVRERARLAPRLRSGPQAKSCSVLDQPDPAVSDLQPPPLLLPPTEDRRQPRHPFAPPGLPTSIRPLRPGRAPARRRIRPPVGSFVTEARVASSSPYRMDRCVRLES